MKIFFPRIQVMWRRFRRAGMHGPQHLQYASQLASLMKRANPFACWIERANWIIDVVEWIRREPETSQLDRAAWLRIKLQRATYMLDWLDANRATQRVVRATVQKTLREAVGPDIFSTTGLPRKPGFFGELRDRVMRRILPKPLAHRDLPALFMAMFPQEADADWLLALDRTTLSGFWKLCADPAIQHAYRAQIDEALLYLSAMIASAGIDPAISLEQGARMPLHATPFMVLRRELDLYLSAGANSQAAPRGVRMLIAVCQAQIDRICEHQEQCGVSVNLVYRIETMRAHLTRMAHLIDVRSAHGSEECHRQLQNLLVDLIAAHRQSASVRGLFLRGVSLLTRRVADRDAAEGDSVAARGHSGYRRLVKAACIGGVVAAGAALSQLALLQAGFANFFEGVFVSVNFAVCFLMISGLGGMLATSQPVIAGATLASRMDASGAGQGVRGLAQEMVRIMRSQAAAVFGNLLGTLPAALAMAAVIAAMAQTSLLAPRQALDSIQGLSIFGFTPLFAAVTGILLWLSWLAGGLADNWFALRRMRDALTHHRGAIQVLGPAVAARCAEWLDRNVSTIAANLALALLLGMTPAALHFFGLAFEVRHVILSAAALAVAASSLGWAIFGSSDLWLALGGIATCWLLNAGVAFACAFSLALKGREIPARARPLGLRTLLRTLAAIPGLLFFARRRDANLRLVSRSESSENARTEKRAHHAKSHRTK